MKVLEQERDWYLQQAAIADRMGDNSRSNEYLRLAREREQRMINQSRGLDIYGAPLPGYKIKGGQVIKIPKAGAGKTVDWGKLQKDIATEDITIKETIPGKTVLGVEYPSEEVERKMTYREAFDYLMSVYSGMVKNKGRLKKLIRRVLKTKGLTPPQKPSYTDRAKSEGQPD